ncbi:hypothetical protein Goari_002550, partial [Gossypium aridum]|nr:hypothetical protein [Gossypium aridum]
GSQFFARAPCKPGVQVGPETHKRIGGQLGLPVDGSVVTRSVQSTDWGSYVMIF